MHQINVFVVVIVVVGSIVFRAFKSEHVAFGLLGLQKQCNALVRNHQYNTYAKFSVILLLYKTNL